jgi:hypothetical protein
MSISRTTTTYHADVSRSRNRQAAFRALVAVINANREQVLLPVSAGGQKKEIWIFAHTSETLYPATRASPASVSGCDPCGLPTGLQSAKSHSV